MVLMTRLAQMEEREVAAIDHVPGANAARGLFSLGSKPADSASLNIQSTGPSIGPGMAGPRLNKPQTSKDMTFWEGLRNSQKGFLRIEAKHEGRKIFYGSSIFGTKTGELLATVYSTIRGVDKTSEQVKSGNLKGADAGAKLAYVEQNLVRHLLPDPK